MGCIGIAVFPEHGASGETLLQRAEVAMYAAKRSGNSYSVYRKEDDPYDASLLVLRADLRRAIERREIVLYYQPQVALIRSFPKASRGSWQGRARIRVG
jgi:predicted signal transduction protein with EAL and GGDEF domain